MSNNIVPIDQAVAHVPAAARQRVQQGLATNKSFSDGVRDSFPILSIRGKSFHARINGQETPFIDPQTRSAIGHLDVVLVKGSITLAKTYYIRGYTPGDLNPPDCWSMDSVRPDASVPNKVSISCITCPMNMFGSARPRDNAPPEAGKRTGKACQDSRRIAVIMPHMIGSPEPLVMMLRVPQSSLKNLKNYAQMLERHGIDPSVAITRLQFDYAEAFPKLLFNFVNVLDDQSYATVVELSDSSTVKGMLDAPDFDNAPSVTPVQNPQVGPVLQPLAQQQAPILGGTLGAGIPDDEDEAVIPGLTMPPAGPVHANVQTGMTYANPPLSQPIHASPMPQQQPQPTVQLGDDLIELPGGKWYSRSKNAFVDGPVVPVAPPPDPNVIALPNGQYFNTATKQYVSGPHVGAAPEVDTTSVSPQPAPVTRKRAASAKKEPAKQPEAVAAQPAAEPAKQPEPVQTVDNSVQNGGDAHPGAGISATSKSLDDILRSVLPPTRTQ